MATASERPSHAGAVVYREGRDRLEVLLVTARRRPTEWVLPKGHLEPGEAPEQAARREVAEEAGVLGSVERELGTIALDLPHERQTVRVYLMRAEGETPPSEARGVAWLTLREAEARATHRETKELIAAARTALAEGASGVEGSP